MANFIASKELSKRINDAFRNIVLEHVGNAGYYEKRNFDMLVKSYVKDMRWSDYSLTETRLVVYHQLMKIFVKGVVPNLLSESDLFGMSPAKIYLYIIAQKCFAQGKVTSQDVVTIQGILVDYDKEWNAHFETNKA